MTNPQRWNRLDARMKEIEVYARTLGKLSYDMECCAPEDGLEQAGKDMAQLGRRVHRLTHAKGFQELVCRLHEDSDGLTQVQKKAVEHLYRDYEKEKNLSEAFSFQRDTVSARAYADWLKAKGTGDYSLFRDVFAENIELTRQAVALRDRKYDSTYAACLDDNEPGSTVEQMDAFFDALRKGIVPLMQRIQRDGKHIREDFLTRPCPVPVQERFARFLLQAEGLRESSLVLMTTEHPFTTNFGARDVRVTTHYYEDNFVSNIFTVLHEGGHALFMQNEPEEMEKNHCADRMSNAMHECISRFYENIIGRSPAFIHYLYPKFREFGGETFADVTEQELYEAVNIARPGLIRMESDELTYCLHILVRYELEKAFVNGEISVDDVPRMWNEKMKDLLGVEVPDDVRGCLQDVHWTSDYGYFPSYALGNAYGAQILRTMEKDFDVSAAVAAGELYRVRDWLKEHVFSCAGLLTPDEWIRTITGESLNPQYYLDYLTEKFTAVYALK